VYDTLFCVRRIWREEGKLKLKKLQGHVTGGKSMGMRDSMGIENRQVDPDYHSVSGRDKVGHVLQQLMTYERGEEDERGSKRKVEQEKLR